MTKKERFEKINDMVFQKSAARLAYQEDIPGEPDFDHPANRAINEADPQEKVYLHSLADQAESAVSGLEQARRLRDLPAEGSETNIPSGARLASSPNQRLKTIFEIHRKFLNGEDLDSVQIKNILLAYSSDVLMKNAKRESFTMTLSPGMYY